MGSYLVYRPLDGHLFLRGVRNSGLFQGIVFYFAVHGAVIVPDTIVLCVDVVLRAASILKIGSFLYQIYVL